VADLGQWIDRYGTRIETAALSVIVLIIAIVVIAFAGRQMRRVMPRLEQHFPLSPGATLLICRIVSAILWVCTALIILSLWGLSVSGLWTFLVSAITLIGVGFLATWAIVSNVTANFFLSVWRPFHLGQTVSLLPEDLKGRVVDRTMMFTELREEGGASLMIPNNLFFQKMFRVGENVVERSPEAGEPASEIPDDVGSVPEKLPDAMDVGRF